MSLWLVSMCCRKCGPWTQYFRRTTQPILVILDKMPSVSTLCIGASSLVHCTWWPSASRHPLTIWYPAWGSLDLMALTSLSRASSVMVEYRLLTDMLYSCILLYMVLLETPRMSATHVAGRPRWRRLWRWSSVTCNLKRPWGPILLTTDIEGGGLFRRSNKLLSWWRASQISLGRATFSIAFMKALSSVTMYSK